ncbi:IS3 family transposase [Desulfotomaculum defluvii]
MENFFGHLKSELLYNNFFLSKEDFIESLQEYLNYYNNERIKKKLGYLSPVDYRNRFEAA